MRTRLALTALLLAAFVFAAPARADDKVVFYEDPVFKPLNDGDEHPMSDLIKLSENGDTRAQFILGDLYAKGKGGLVKSHEKARHWFNQSAINGYGASFIRLGALAKREGKMIEAYSWYDLGASLAGGKDGRYAAKARDALNLSDEDEDKADELSDAWRKQKAQALQEKEEAEKAKREEQKTIDTAKKAAEEAAGVKGDAARKDTKKITGTSKTENKPAPQPSTGWTQKVKERSYND